MEYAFVYTIAVFLGLAIGSFLTVCIYRIPLGRELGIEEEEEGAASETAIENEAVLPTMGITHPRRSVCPNCGTTLRAWHNIPVISWVLLRGKCAFCSANISFRYPAVEIITAIVCVLCVVKFGPTLTALGMFLFCAALITISFIDYDYYIIPNVISLPGVVIGLVLAVINQFTKFLNYPFALTIFDSVLGMLIGGGFLFLVSEIYYLTRKKEGLGMGDVKLLAMTGAFFGIEGALYTIFIGSLLGSILGILFALLAGRQMSKPLPFGPYLAFATFMYIFLGPDLGFSGLSWKRY